MTTIETVFGSCTIMDKPFIDLSDKMLENYAKLGNYYSNDSVYITNEPTGLLIGKLSGRKINDILVFKLTWGYSMEGFNAISVDELKNINFIGNLDSMLDDNYSTSTIQLLFALIGTIAKHYNKNCVIKNYTKFINR